MVSIIGGGSAALLLAAELDPAVFDLRIYEANAALARKFLVAGQGGFNLTHAEPASAFITRYTPSAFLTAAFEQFDNHRLQAWLQQLGVPTRTGGSGRVFPQHGMKPIEVLQAFQKRLSSQGVHIYTRHKWTGFDAEGRLCFANGQRIAGGLVVFCLGGASWPVTGSNQEWPAYFRAKGIAVHPFEASNCAWQVAWPQPLPAGLRGAPLKNLVLRCGTVSVAGEVVLTREGLEGSGIYPLSAVLRQTLRAQGEASLFVDLKPAVASSTLEARLRNAPHTGSYTERVAAALHLGKAALHLLKLVLSKDDFLDPARLCGHVKSLRLRITSAGPIETAISTVGGIALEELTPNFELKKLPGHFAIGEMLDYDAPTGGYLLQSCFSMGHYLAGYLNQLHAAQRSGLEQG